MRKLLFILFLLFPFAVSATTAVPWYQRNLTDTFFSPTLVNGINLAAKANNFIATSTTATSTFSGPVNIIPNSIAYEPLYIGTGTCPIYGCLPGDLLDAQWAFNGGATINTVNPDSGTCAFSGYYANGNNPLLTGYYTGIFFLNTGWSGVGCAVGNGSENANDTLITNPNGNIVFETIGSVSISGGSDSATAVSNADASLFQANYFDTPYISAGEYQNFLLQTEAFGTTWVSNVGVITSNSAVDPRGTVLAEQIPAGTLSTSGVFQDDVNAVNGMLTFSVYLKAQSGTGTTTLEIDDGTGSATTTGTGKIVNLTTQWKRYAVTQNVTDVHTLVQVDIWNGTTAIAAWGAQLEAATSTRPYSGARTTTALAAVTRNINLNAAVSTLGALAITGTLTGVTTGAFSGTITNTISASATSTILGDGPILTSATAATAVLNAQESPRIRFCGQVWNGLSTTTCWTIQNVPQATSSASYVGSQLNFSVLNANVANYVTAFTINSGTSTDNKPAPTVGISTTTPFGEFAIQATSDGIYAGNNIIYVSSSTSGGATSTLFSLKNTGTISIGTSSQPSFFTVQAASSSAAFAHIFDIWGIINAVDYVFQYIDEWGHLITSGPVPTVTGGTSSVAGNDRNGTITVVGTALTSITLNFAYLYAAAPDCVISDSSTGITAGVSSISTSQMVVAFSIGVNSGTVWYICQQHQ